MKTKTKAVLHGECVIFQSKVPKNAKKENLKGPYTIVAPSETTGNHHVVDLPEGVEFYTLDGVRYMKNSVPTKVRCTHTARHDDITLAPGEWEIGIQQEYDYHALAKRNVRD